MLKYFTAGAMARPPAALAGVNRRTAALYFHKLREIVAGKAAAPGPMGGEIEAGESYFGGERKGKRGRGAAGKVPQRAKFLCPTY